MSDTHKLDLNQAQGSVTPTAGPGHGKKGRLAALAVGENIKEKQVNLHVHSMDIHKNTNIYI